MLSKAASKIIILLTVLLLCCGCADNTVNNNADGEYPPMIKLEEQYYLLTGYTLKNVDESQLEQIGEVLEEQSHGRPEKNYQANMLIKGAPIYRYIGQDAYENHYLLEDDILVYYDEQYMIFESEKARANNEWENRKVQPY